MVKYPSSGAFIISLDFELMWGGIDCMKKDVYGETHIRQVPEIIYRMLALFNKYGIHATFATVGMIMYHDPQELLNDLPAIHPTYVDSSLSPYENQYIQRILEHEESLFFQLDLVREIKSHNDHEIGTHTFSHYYCWAKGQNDEQFESDIRKAIEVAARFDIPIKSIVFPRNQVSDKHLKICSKLGITAYRGNALKYFNEPHNRFEATKNRICRLLDAYINIGGNTSIPYSKLEYTQGMLNVRASRMLRPYVAKISFAERLRLRRIKKEMYHAAKNGELYHLWWHPHNFGAFTEENFKFLEEILKFYKDCHDRFGMQSYTMNEFVELMS